MPAHPLLKRQLRKHFGESVPVSVSAFVGAVDKAYAHFDDDIRLVERSLELSSTELNGLNAALRAKQRELEGHLEQLQYVQEKLVAQEKLASLGGIAAGVAHEIKNPLNFVNNFAEIAKEIAGELSALVEKNEPVDRSELRELCELLQENMVKIVHHGKRADGVVKSMLLHARGQSKDVIEGDLNAVVEEYCNLAFHGLRARDPSLTVRFEKDLCPQVKSFRFSPQEIARVILNIVGNACEAAWERAKQDPSREAVVSVTTKHMGPGVRVVVRDNGLGVPEDIRKRIFDPFFTTKPPGKGTGLGLSISFDILRAHGGDLHLDTVSGEFAAFQICLPYEGSQRCTKRTA